MSIAAPSSHVASDFRNIHVIPAIPAVRFASNFWLLTARLSQCPLRSESDRSAALPRIDAMCQ